MRPSLRLLTCCSLLFGLLAPAAPAHAGQSAIHPKNRPAPVPGESNGEMRREALVGVEGSCRTARSAGPSLALMLAAARADGVKLIPDDCYRLRDAQARAKNNSCSKGNCACAAGSGFSMHGWGKAVDFDDSGGTVRFTSEGYSWMKANAARFGWNHPGWAEPGGSTCPEAWHWEWVGDGGNMGLDPIRADVVGVVASRRGSGYWGVGGLGTVAARGDAADHGSAAGTPISQLVKGAAATPSGAGYWLVARDGGVFCFGDAGFFGSLGGRPLNQPIVAMAPTPTGKGYWMVASDGGVFTFGDAGFFGSLGDRRLNRPIVAMGATPTGRGYWLVASDGGVFTFGDAPFLGSLGGSPPAEPVVGMAASPTGRGYWLAGADGAVSPFGDARSAGTLAGVPLNLPVVGVAATPTGAGYWLVAADGGIFAFGDARFHGTA
jgi:D-alanyl-D-alanine carboxypeptidase